MILWMEEFLHQLMVYPIIIPFFTARHSYQDLPSGAGWLVHPRSFGNAHGN
jgi:hypothetical protein